MEKKKNTAKAPEKNKDSRVEQLATAEIVAKSSVTTKKKKAAPARKYNTRRVSEGMVKSRKRVALPIGTILGLLVATLLLMMMIGNYVVINEYTHEAAALRSQLNQLSVEKDKLTVELEKKNDYMTMQQYASDNLGMIGEEDVDKVYIEVDENDSIEVFEVEEDGTKGVIATVMSALSDNFIKAWNTLTKGE